jgi:hypothetical protein
MLNDSLQRGSGAWGSPRNISGGQFNSYAGVNVDRSSRFEARSARRWGDWGILEIPASFLWLDEACELSPYEECEFAWPVLVELWP